MTPTAPRMVIAPMRLMPGSWVSNGTLASPAASSPSACSNRWRCRMANASVSNSLATRVICTVESGNPSHHSRTLGWKISFTPARRAELVGVEHRMERVLGPHRQTHHPPPPRHQRANLPHRLGRHPDAGAEARRHAVWPNASAAFLSVIT